MKTTPPTQLANVVNTSVTMFFHSVQRLTAAPTGGGVPGGRTSALCLRARPAFRSPPRPCSFGPPMPRRSRARGRAAWTIPAASAGVDGSAVRLASFISRIEGENRSHARGSALALGAGRVASAAWRIEELASAAGDQGSAEAPRSPRSIAVDEALAEIDRIRG